MVHGEGELYDRLANGYREHRSLTPEALRPHLDIIIRMGNIGRDTDFLDIGCGIGNHAMAVSVMAGSNVTGVDPSNAMLEVARERAPEMNWQQGSMGSIPLDDGSMDVVFTSMTLHHLPDMGQGFREVHRVLRPGGRFIIITSLPERFVDSVLARFPGLVELDAGRFPDDGTIRDTLVRAGLSVVEQVDVPRLHATNKKAELLEKVRGRFVSTFELMDEQDFIDGLVKFEKWLDSIPGDTIHDASMLSMYVSERAAR